MAALGMYHEDFAIPHPEVDQAIFEVLEDGIRFAWRLLETYPPEDFVISEETYEVPINYRLHEALVDRVWNRGCIEGFDELIFQNIERGPEVCNFDGTQLEKRPDMLARLTGRPQNVKRTQDGIFVECKPIDDARPLTTAYCRLGIRRFVDGGYGWAMQDALMIGYTEGEADVVSDLSEAFIKENETVDCVSIPTKSGKFDVTILTLHRRNFIYRQNGNAAPPISLRHLWLSRFQSSE